MAQTMVGTLCLFAKAITNGRAAFGSATSEIYQLAYGTDAPRYLRALCVPMNVSRFAICALSYVDELCVKKLIELEHYRYYGSLPSQTRNLQRTSAEGDDTDIREEYEQEIVQENSTRSKGETQPSSQEPKSAHPNRSIDDKFKADPILRASVCLGALLYGIPSGSSSPCDSEGVALFDLTAFHGIIKGFAGPEHAVPEPKEVLEYVEGSLVPHCLKLCIEGNGPSTRNARGSHGDYETAFGISTHPEPSLPNPSPLPDPCLATQEHSLEALGYSYAILRRSRLLRSCVSLCSSTENKELVQAVLKSKNITNTDGMPVWWQPEVHDTALLMEASRKGLFSVLRNRDDSQEFSKNSIQQTLLRTLNESNLSGSSPSLLAISNNEACKFPTMFQLERRLAYLCALATEKLSDDDKFHILPMFDHGSWPRN